MLNTIAPQRKAKPPKQAAPPACKDPLLTCGVGSMGKVCNAACAILDHCLCSCYWSNTLSGMQALPSPSVVISPTRLRSGKLVGKVMDNIGDILID